MAWRETGSTSAKMPGLKSRQIQKFWPAEISHNLQHMALLRISTTVFCMVFRSAPLICLTPKTQLGTMHPTLVSRLGCWPDRGLFWAQHGARKKMDLLKKGFPMGFQGDLCEGKENDCMLSKRPLGKPISPPPKPIRKIRFRGFPIAQKNPWEPLGPCGVSYWPLVELWPI